MTVTVLSAVFGGYDRPKPPVEQTVDTRWLLVTDDPTFARLNGWDVNLLRPMKGLEPRRAAKYPKMRPWDFTDTDVVIWVDASVQVTSPEFVAMCLDNLPPGGIAAWRHPARDCIYTELAHSLAMPKYAGEPMGEQCAHYASVNGHPHHWGLWAAGILAWDRSATTKKLGRMWLDEIDRWSTQDQLSLPVVCRQLGIRPAELPQNLLANDWCRVMPHPREWL